MPSMPFTTRIWTTLAHTDRCCINLAASTLPPSTILQSRLRSCSRTGRIDCPVPFRILARLVDGHYEFTSLEHRSRLEQLSFCSCGIARPVIYTYVPTVFKFGRHRLRVDENKTLHWLAIGARALLGRKKKPSPTLPTYDVGRPVLLPPSNSGRKHQSDHRS
ncbi:hypothetical protein LY76DRAFT_161871 [Colletotrichum caudatum]|nr:hypothetical protein LY76DRAFT_161871 [Colletotrichum caudatum]